MFGNLYFQDFETFLRETNTGAIFLEKNKKKVLDAQKQKRLVDLIINHFMERRICTSGKVQLYVFTFIHFYSHHGVFKFFK